MLSFRVGPKGDFTPFFPFTSYRNAVMRKEEGELLIATPVWSTRAWYPNLLHMPVALPILLPWNLKLLQGSQKQIHFLVANQPAAWLVCSNRGKRKTFLATPPDFSWQLSDQAQVYDSAWKKCNCWCLGRKVDPFCLSVADIVNFLFEGLEYRPTNRYCLAFSRTLSPIEGFPIGDFRTFALIAQ